MRPRRSPPIGVVIGACIGGFGGAACGGERTSRAPVPPPVAIAPAPDAAVPRTPDGAPAGPPAPPAWLAPYAADVARILETAAADRRAFDRLAHLTDHIGARLSGSPALDLAIAWASRTLEADGHAVTREPVMVPRWVRGAESAALLAPIKRPLRVLGLGGTVGTGRRGVTADVVVVTSWDDLAAKGAAAVAGKLVLFDVAMPAYSEEHGTGYGGVVGYRYAAAREAAKLGAVGVLMRSVTARSLATLHTGSMAYEDGVPKIPAAAVTTEDASLIARLAAAGPVRVSLSLGARQLPDVPSANVIAELRGDVSPDEVVVLGAHLDSWDVGQGAHDDGAGCLIMMHALTTLRELGLAPRRTIRVVLFTNEENGLRGAKAYAAAHASELASHVLALEADGGGFAPRGFELELPASPAPGVVDERLAAIAGLLAPLDAHRLTRGHGGADLAPMVAAGVPGLGLAGDSSTYFDVHHTEADTLDKVDPAQLAANVAVVAALAYVVADLPTRLDAAAEPTP